MHRATSATTPPRVASATDSLSREAHPCLAHSVRADSFWCASRTTPCRFPHDFPACWSALACYAKHSVLFALTVLHERVRHDGVSSLTKETYGPKRSLERPPGRTQRAREIPR